ncbi:hypothetical protein D3C84_1173200 [compost metagenome]
MGGDQPVEGGEVGLLRGGGIQVAQVGLGLLRGQRVHGGRLRDDEAWMLAEALAGRTNGSLMYILINACRKK